MESDSSLENEEPRQRREWDNVGRENSDVSDDENFSRGAKSIESPPESPPWCGTNLDSPPASPAQEERSEGISPSSMDNSSPSRASSEHRENNDESSIADDGNSDDKPGTSPRGDKSPESESSWGSASPGPAESPGPRRSPRGDSEPGSPFAGRPQTPEDSGPDSPVEQSPVRGNSPDNTPQSPDSEVDVRETQSARNPGAGREESSSPIRQRDQSSDSESDRQQSRTMYSDSEEENSPRYHRHSSESKLRSHTSSSQRQVKSTNSDGLDSYRIRQSPTCDKERQDYKRGRKSPSSNKLRQSPNSVRISSDRGRKSPAPNKDRRNSDSDRIRSPDSSSERKSQSPKRLRHGKRRSPDLDRRSGSSMGPQSPKRSLSRNSERSNTSLSSVGSEKKSPLPKVRSDEKPADIKTHGEDLSDVSDIESLGALSDDSKRDDTKKGEKSEKEDLILVEEGEQLDFEAEEQEKEENGELGKDRDDLEEGELSDEGEVRPEETEPRPVCRFFSRGQCTWGSSCRFVHPGVTDKGNYTMFEMVRPLVPMNAGGPMMHPPPPHHHMYPPPMDPYHRPPPMERPPMMGPPPFQQPARKEEPPGESAWERGLRQAKEMIRKSSKRKETEVDFEEKKMTLTGGQEEVDKENEFYSSPTPFVDEHYDRYSKIEERRSSREGYRERGGYDGYSGGGGGYYHREPWHGPPGYEEAPRGHPRYQRHQHQGSREHYRERVDYDYYENSAGGGRKRKYTTRDGEAQPTPASGQDKQYDRSPSPSSRRYERERRAGSKGGGRGDEWADPWMRSKSPSRKASRRKSYSSRSSYSSSSSSRSSSYSSYSRSRSGSRSSGTRSSRSRSAHHRAAHKSPQRRAKSPFSREKRGSDVERLLHMNPPAPSPRSAVSPSARRNPTPPLDRRERSGLSARLLAAAIRGQRSESRSSSSGSDSSGSSDDSSSSDDSGSSSSRSPSPQPLPPQKHLSSRKKVVLDEKLAQAMKVKAMDALKLSGQKQQIKLNLKGRDSIADRIHQMPLSSRKRLAESPPFDDDSPPSSKLAKKAPPSRREELLKQLKAVEDAIARKRSKI